MKGFAIAGASVPGSDHTKPGKPGWTNNHDAFDFEIAENYLVAVVCDGCGSIPHAEVGAKIGARLVVRNIVDAIRSDPELELSSFETGFNSYLKVELMSDLQEIAAKLDSNVPMIVQMYFLFTIVGVVMTPEFTAIFTFGDGVYSLNGETVIVPPAEGNAPPYVGQLLAPGLMHPKHLKFTVHRIISTMEVKSILIGTDGVRDFIAAEQLHLPGKDTLVGPLSQFWTDQRYVDNPDCIRRRLALTNLEITEEVGDHVRIRSGHLKDDTTLMVIRRDAMT